MKIVATTASPVSAEVSVPSLFLNDKAWERDDIMPLEHIDGVYYIPIEFIKRIVPVKVKSWDYFKDNFYIIYNDNEWIAFKISADKAYTWLVDYIPCKVYTIRGTTYVPAQIVADALGLTVEIRQQYNALRLKEKDAKRNFDDIIESYVRPLFTPPTDPPTTTDPPVITAPPVETTTAPPVITPTDRPNENNTTEKQENIPTIRTTEPTTPEPTTPEDTREINNYLLFYDSYMDEENEENKKDGKMEKTDEVLEILEKENIRAVFFFSGGEIIENPDIIRKIYAAGHETGIKFETGRINFGAEELISELEAVNDLIYSVLKHKTRFCIFDENEKIPGEFYEDKTEDILKESGYYLCEKTLDDFDLKNINNPGDMIEFMKTNALNVFVYDLNGAGGDYKNYLDLSARAAEIKFYIKISYINNANIDDIKYQINKQSNKIEDGD